METATGLFRDGHSRVESVMAGPTSFSTSMTTNQKEGMRTLEISLAELIASGTISYEDALEVSAHPKELARAMSAVGVPAKA